MTLAARRLVLFFFGKKTKLPVPSTEMNTFFPTFVFLRCFFLHRSRMTTLALRHVLNTGRQECEQMASRGEGVATRGSPTAVNRGACRKPQEMAQNAEGSRNIFRVFTCLTNPSLIGAHGNVLLRI